MKLATLLIPANMPPAYEGATPVPYQSGMVDRFEKSLADLAPGFIRQPNATRLMPDKSGRWASPQIVTPYQFMVNSEATTLGDAITLTLNVFKLDKVTVVVVEAENEEFTKDMALDLQSGIHF